MQKLKEVWGRLMKGARVEPSKEGVKAAAEPALEIVETNYKVGDTFELDNVPYRVVDVHPRWGVEVQEEGINYGMSLRSVLDQHKEYKEFTPEQKEYVELLKKYECFHKAKGTVLSGFSWEKRQGDTYGNYKKEMGDLLSPALVERFLRNNKGADSDDVTKWLYKVLALVEMLREGLQKKTLTQEQCNEYMGRLGSQEVWNIMLEARDAKHIHFDDSSYGRKRGNG